MASVAKRTRGRSRQTLSWAATDSDAPSRQAPAIPALRSSAAAVVGGGIPAGGARARVRVWNVAPSRPPDVVVISDDDEDGGAQSVGGGGGRNLKQDGSYREPTGIGSPLKPASLNVATKTPSKLSRRRKEERWEEEEESLPSSDRRAVVVEYDSGGGGGGGSEGTVEGCLRSTSDSNEEEKASGEASGYASGGLGDPEAPDDGVQERSQAEGAVSRSEPQEVVRDEMELLEAHDANVEGETQEIDDPEVASAKSEAKEVNAGNEVEVLETDASGEGEVQALEHDDAEDNVEAEQAQEPLETDQEYESPELGHSTMKRETPRGHNLMTASCIARRTRSQVGKQVIVSYRTYFEDPESLEDPKEKEGDEEEEEEEEDKEEDESYHMADNAEATNTGTETTSKGSGEEGESPGVVLKRKKFSGIDILVPVSNEKNDGERPVSSGSTGVATRTRSHFKSELNKKKRKLGTMSKPYCLDVSASDPESDLGLSSSGEEDEKNGRQKEVNNGGANKMDVDGRGEGRVRRGSGKANKRKRVQASKDYDFHKLLADTIWNNMEKLPGDLNHPKDEFSPIQESPSCHEDPLPLIFSFGDEDPKLMEKAEDVKALDELWADFKFAMEADNVGIYHPDESQTEEINIPEVQSYPSNLCSQGKHKFILDEQIGIKCQFCSLVDLEIRHILPPWATHLGESSTRNNFAKVDSPLTFNDLFQTAESDGNQGCSGVLKGTVWDLIPGIKTTMYQHQQEAFEFMWKNLAGGILLDQLKSVARSDIVGGCVISHAPGTGKTRLTIVFIQTYMKVFPDCRPVIVAPCGMLRTWEKEFQKWDVSLPIHNLNTLGYSGKEDNAAYRLVEKSNRNRNLIRLVKLYSWAKGNSILGISYGLFKKFVGDRSNGDQVSDILLEKPGLLILDEGHTPRNERSLIWKALAKVKTEKRIILSGTPFQNNFLELYNILWLVRPKFAERFSTKTKLCRRRSEFIKDREQDIAPEKNEGKEIWTSLTNNVTNNNAEEVRYILKPFVHIHNGDILKTLPGLRECVIVLDPLPLQKNIIEKVQHIGSTGNFENEYKISLAAIHPSLVTHIDFSREEESLIDKNLLEELKWNPYEGVKTKFVLEVVRLCKVLKEKVLVFSQYIQPLAMIKDQLKKSLHWSEGKEVLQMDGKLRTEIRQPSIDIFNDMESEARVLLASTKACCEGISLTGASRVILLDVVWNPAVGRQAISRAHRIGQKKVVYTYNLITSGTREREKYEKQAMKDQMSKLVFSPDNFTNFKNLSQAEEKHPSRLISEDKILEEMTDRLKDMFIQIYYPPKECSEF